jgi:sec-independent protein translocase protein TatB
MFDIGFSELLVIALVALIVFGPKRLPEMARTAGHWMGRLRRFMENVKQDLDRELNTEELAQFKKLQEELAQTRAMLQSQGDKTWELITSEPKVDEPTLDTPQLEAPKPEQAATGVKKAAKRRPRRPRTTKKAAKTAAVTSDVTAKKTDGENP